MKLLNIRTQEEFDGIINVFEEKEFENIKKSDQFLFDWQMEKESDVFKIIFFDKNEKEKILGLISISNIPEEYRIHINLVEVAKDNRGKDKKIDRIAGCLLAFATKIAFEKGYLGFTSLIPKTELIEHYITKYGFSQYGKQLAIERQAAINLIQKYL